MESTSCSIHAWEVSADLQHQLEGAGDALTSEMTMFTKPSDEKLQDQMMPGPDSIAEIVSLADLGSVIRVASSCKLLRRYILQPFYVPLLNTSARFAASMFLGHFLSFRNNAHPRLRFVSTPHQAQSRLIADIESTMDDEHIGNLDDFSPLGSDRGFMVLREHMDPMLCVWNPLTKILVYLPTVVDGIIHRSSCILEVGAASFQLNLVKLRLNRSERQIETFTSPVFSLSSSRNRPITSGMWTQVPTRQIPGPAARIAKPGAFPVVLNHVSYWLCKRAGSYVILKVKLDTLDDPTFIPVPVQCSLTFQFHRNNILLVPSAAGGRLGVIGLSSGFLGLVALDNNNFTIWTIMSVAGEWARRAVISKGRVLKSLGILRTQKSVQQELFWCAKESGLLLVNVPGFGSAILNFNTLEAGFVEKTAVEREHHPLIRLRGSCPFEFDSLLPIKNEVLLDPKHVFCCTDHWSQVCNGICGMDVRSMPPTLTWQKL